MALDAADLKDQFQNPPQSTRPRTWWHWMNGYVTKEGITADLESMKRIGLAGVQLFDAELGVEAKDIKPVPYLSPEHLDLLEFTASEAKRLGLEFTMVACAGWSELGAPWVESSWAMQRMVWSEKQVTGPAQFSEDLPALPSENDPIPPEKKKPAPAEHPNTASKTPPKAVDSCVVAYRSADANAVVAKEQVIDLTAKLDSNGKLTWEVPEGNWTIARFGSYPKGTMNHPARAEGTGFETDKLSAEATRKYFQEWLKQIGSSVEGGLNALLCDSWEAGDQDWTPGFIEAFKKLRGYDPVPYMPALLARTVGNKEISDRFLRDVKRTRADLVADQFYGELNGLITKKGLRFYCEAPGVGDHFGDKLQCKSRVDIPMAEFWTPNKTNQRPDVNAYTKHVMNVPDCKEAASSAHLLGKEIVAAEAFTSGGRHAPWQGDPYSLKAEADFHFALGITRFCFHTFAAQPYLDRVPGMTMAPFGQHFNRNATWWDHGGKEWIDYLSRCEYLLMQGQFVADVCLFYGEDAPVSGRSTWADTKAIPTGYDFDLCDAEALLKATVKEGRVTMPSGMSYRVVYVPERITAFSPELAAKIRDLVNAGATVLAARPTRAPGLNNYPACDEEVKRIASEVWGEGNAVDRKLGQGRIFAGKPLAEVLDTAGVKPDLLATPETPWGYRWIHRQIGEKELYFVSNQNPEAVKAEVSFRVAGREPQLWDAATGSVVAARGWRVEDGRTILPLTLDPSGSMFVLFDKQTQLQVGEPPREIVADKSLPIEGEWEVAFQAGRGAPAKARFEKLASWETNAEEGIKYFSGTATYTKTLEVPAVFTKKGNRIRLSLGEVQVIAEVSVNGKQLATLWKPPFTADLTGVLKKGRNTLEIKVTNLWPNRVIGDIKTKANPPIAQLIYPCHYYQKNQGLLPSGLLGPVALEVLK